MSKRARITRGQSSSSQRVSIKEKVRMLGVFESGVHQMRHDAFSRCRFHSEDIIDWDFLANQGLAQAFFEYDPNHLGVRFRLGGEQKEISLLELGWRIGLYSDRQSRESATLSGLRKGVTVKANHLLLGFWPTIGDDGFNVGNTKVAAIRDPRVKLAHCCIATTIAGRKESTHRVTEINLFYLYCIYSDEVVCNILYWLAKYMVGMREKSLISREAIEEDDEGDEEAGGGAGHEGAGGSAHMYQPRLNLTRRSLEVLRKFHWMILGGQFN
ncbi:hypothetical protein Tco_1268782 [Tanacetum coccineum]